MIGSWHKHRKESICKTCEASTTRA